MNPNATWRMLEVVITNVHRTRNGLNPITDIYGEYVNATWRMLEVITLLQMCTEQETDLIP